MATKKFLIEIKEGWTGCESCIACPDGNCDMPIRILKTIDCDKYNFATMKITEMEEEKCEK